jgi:hypothetical protein
MTPQEFEYIRRAMKALESGECSHMAEAKILQTMSEITGRAADKIRGDLELAVDQKLEENYCKIQNRKLIDTIRG